MTQPVARFKQEECQPQFILIGVDDEKSRVEIHLRGAFIAPQYCSAEIATLYSLAKEYRTIVVYINSPGGQADTLGELLTVLELFDLVITVAAGSVMSAGFMLWSRGDIRVVQPYAHMMMHRESYAIEGKTRNHLDYAQYSDRVFSTLVHDLCDMLTDEEKIRCELTEVFFAPSDMIEREAAISWQQFVEGDNNPVERRQHTIVTIRGMEYVEISNNLVCPVNSTDEEEVYFTPALIYGLPEKNLAALAMIDEPVIVVEEQTVEVAKKTSTAVPAKATPSKKPTKNASAKKTTTKPAVKA